MAFGNIFTRYSSTSHIFLLSISLPTGKSRWKFTNWRGYKHLHLFPSVQRNVQKTFCNITSFTCSTLGASSHSKRASWWPEVWGFGPAFSWGNRRNPIICHTEEATHIKLLQFSTFSLFPFPFDPPAKLRHNSLLDFLAADREVSALEIMAQPKHLFKFRRPKPNWII